MSWREILKIALDTEGNSYGGDKWLEGPLTGPAMVLAEKRETPMYVIYLDHEDGLMYDDLKQAKEVSSQGGGDITVIKPTDKKTLMTGLNLYKVIAEGQDVDEQTKDYTPEALEVKIGEYLEGKVKSGIIYRALEAASYATSSFSGYYGSDDKEKVKEQLQEVLEELYYMSITY